ncbi:MAG: hypothetical protein Q7N50_13645 [Armatimonadota bacterium]|nr:hypothetical protein [Armatimonadota bacterium]
MPIIYQKIIMRADLIANSDVLYIFGDNETRKGFGGQAKEMRGCPNAVGVRTKRAPLFAADAYWRDSDGKNEERKAMVDADLLPAVAKLKSGGVVVIPSDGVGTGFARLAELSPEILKYIKWRLDGLVDFIPDQERQ